MSDEIDYLKLHDDASFESWDVQEGLAEDLRKTRAKLAEYERWQGEAEKVALKTIRRIFAETLRGSSKTMDLDHAKDIVASALTSFATQATAIRKGET